MKLSFAAKILFISFTIQGIAQEEIVSASPAMISNEQTPPSSKPPQSSIVITKKNILYGSLSFIPGGGISVRKRCGSKGTALDYKVGACPFDFDAMNWIPVLSVDYNWLYFSKDKETSPYFSYGIGAAYVIPYVPLRAGIEFKHGFIDVGAKLILGFIPCPEIRAGVNF